MSEKLCRPNREELVRAAWRFVHSKDYAVQYNLKEDTESDAIAPLAVWVPQMGVISIFQPRKHERNISTNIRTADEETLYNAMWFEDPTERDIEYFALRVLAACIRR